MLGMVARSSCQAVRQACSCAVQVKRGVPYQIIGGTPFWLRKEVKDVMAYVKLALNPQDDVSLARIINNPSRGIGQDSLQKLKAWAEGQGLLLGQALFANYQVCVTSTGGLPCQAAER